MTRYQRCLDFVSMAAWNALTAIQYDRLDDARKHLYDIIGMINLVEKEAAKLHVESDRFQVMMHVSNVW